MQGGIEENTGDSEFRAWFSLTVLEAENGKSGPKELIRILVASDRKSRQFGLNRDTLSKELKGISIRVFAIKFGIKAYMMSLGLDVLQPRFFWVGSILKYTIVTPANFRLFLVTQQKPWSPLWMGLHQVSILEPFTGSEGIKYINWLKPQSHVLTVASWTKWWKMWLPRRKLGNCHLEKGK